MRGDILFWTSDGTLSSRLIAIDTKGPYAHVSIDLGDGTDISAHAEDGIRVHPLPDMKGIRTVDVMARHANFALEPAITWAQSKVGAGYGFVDIFNQVLRTIHSKFFIGVEDSYDCSDFVTHYLLTGGAQLGDLGEEPHLVTPNDLARFYGLI